MFKIEKQRNEEKFYVVPTSELVQQNFKRYEVPYDTNWEIYRLFRFTPENFFKYIIATYGAVVQFKENFPWVDFYFEDRSKAERFLDEISNRLNSLP